eukprot:CAMPEP_0172672094 /NCGR_PEP_ID=MMETSP1074-20121228/11335_1 /TAXON_ID=2916 /ORGANISM="Ceratium fusus, Strain PA161109" /LENGTH=106 /DNA_ID=CAMNT_0013489235 /DNA_START=51 /DNA_END=372 /DNA_ORIENTATION=-
MAETDMIASHHKFNQEAAAQLCTTRARVSVVLVDPFCMASCDCQLAGSDRSAGQGTGIDPSGNARGKLPLPPHLMEWSVMAVATPINLIGAIAVVLQTSAQIHTRA